MPERVLFLCTGNSCRSQMAEALWRELAGPASPAFSAGSEPAGFVHPLDVEVMPVLPEARRRELAEERRGPRRAGADRSS